MIGFFCLIVFRVYLETAKTALLIIPSQMVVAYVIELSGLFDVEKELLE